MQDANELFDNYLEENFNRHRYEGTVGVRNLEQLFNDLGYSEGQFVGHHYIANFLADNPAAIELLVEFVAERIGTSPEWQESLDLERYADKEAEEDV